MAKRPTLTNYWISYSDLMAGLLFVFLAIIVISNYQYKQKLELIGESIDLREKIAAELEEEFIEHGITEAVVDLVTGDIVFTDKDTQVWFKKNKSDLLDRGKEILEEVMPVYLEVLFDESVTQKKLARILIEGHASQEYDNTLSYINNLELSENRAHEVGKYVIEKNDKHFDNLKKHLVTLGRSFADAEYPAYISEAGRVRDDPDAWKDRKVVIRYTLEFEKMLREMKD